METKVIIMCGGVYDTFKTPKPLSVINGETLLERTIRLLKERNVNDISKILHIFLFKCVTTTTLKYQFS